MKKIFLSVILFNIQQCFAQSDSSEAVKILQQLQYRYNNLQNLSYHSTAYSHNARGDGQESITTATVWLEGRPTDTIFGGVFHLKGSDKERTYDYYYDGQRSLEIDHRSHAVTIFNPYDFPNDERNPAKARTALTAFNTLFVKKELVQSLLEKRPVLKLKDTDLQWVITLIYPVNKFGQETTDTLVIQKAPLELLKTARQVLWNGSLYKYSCLLDNYVVNAQQNADSIALTATYAGYKIKEYKRREESASDTVVPRGKVAAGFTYSTFGGGTASLKNMRGKYVLLDFWETWCGYCIIALPKMKEIYNQYHTKGLEIIGVTTENEKQIEKIIRANQLPYLHAKGDKAILDNYNISGRPAYVLIDKDGKIITTRWEEIEKFLAAL
ncbi:MAG: TlpA disulfide reductase family protein [Chitinophagaceae bacterium]